MLPYFDAELGELQATDSYIAVRTPVEVEKGDVTGFVDAKLVDAAVKEKTDGIRAAKSGRPSFDEYPNAKPPKLGVVWPTPQQIDEGFRVAINAKNLQRAINALGGGSGPNNAVEFVFPAFTEPLAPHAFKPIILRVPDSPRRGKSPKGAVDQAEALVMPIRMNGAQVPSGAAGDMTEPTNRTNQTNQTKKEAPQMPKSKTKTTIPYENVPDNKLTAGQKAARTKALKAAGQTPKATKKDLATTLRKQVQKAKQPAAKKTPAKKTKKTAAKTVSANGLTYAQNCERARKAAETRRKNLAAA